MVTSYFILTNLSFETQKGLKAIIPEEDKEEEDEQKPYV
jgi:hypothetical protein